MVIKVYFIDAFTNSPFKGNPAAVCCLNNHIEREIMQNIAGEFNLSETAFIYPIEDFGSDNKFGIKWFSPKMEMSLCGHATLAASKVIFDDYLINKDIIEYESIGGALKAVKKGCAIELDFPMDSYIECDCSTNILQALNINNYRRIVKGINTNKLIIHLNSQKEVIEAVPNFSKMIEASADFKGIAITAKGEGDYDIISRYFNPWAGVNEDAVTGSVHTALAAYWSDILGKKTLRAYQASQRGGFIDISISGNKRVSLSGEAVVVLKGSLCI